ncbi:unnamed protein product [Rangifer tarandus platyrhynchus]|uniref:Uncharacterized protein n=1 Tax=Rangifer tarandus platyrhynchus TaxID=3082113 RepID=A0AC60A182_RANTA
MRDKPIGVNSVVSYCPQDAINADRSPRRLFINLHDGESRELLPFVLPLCRLSGFAIGTHLLSPSAVLSTGAGPCGSVKATEALTSGDIMVSQPQAHPSGVHAKPIQSVL